MLAMDYKLKFWHYVLRGSITRQLKQIDEQSLAWIPHSALKVRGLTFGRYL